jgi:hypothetical protein
MCRIESVDITVVTPNLLPCINHGEHSELSKHTEIQPFYQNYILQHAKFVFQKQARNQLDKNHYYRFEEEHGYLVKEVPVMQTK